MTTNIGTRPQDIPLNQFLGEMAFMDASPVIGARVTMSTAGNQFLSSGDYVPFSTVIWQRGVEFDTTLYRFEAPTPGIYIFTFNVYKNGAGTPNVIHLIKNGTQPICTTRDDGTSDQTLHGCVIDYATSGDYYGVQISSTSFTAYENEPFGRYTNFSIFRIG